MPARARYDRWDDGEGYAGGVLDVPVKARREGPREIRSPHIPRRETSRTAKSRIPCLLEKSLGSAHAARTKTDTGGSEEHSEAIGATMVKELGIIVP